MSWGGSRTKDKKINYPKSRKRPVSHTVKAHSRQEKPVRSFERGLGAARTLLTKRLKIEQMLNITITMPQICHFCGEEITKKFGQESKSLLFHSLDGDHDNWDPDNKVPAHNGCHIRYHNKGSKRGKQSEEHIRKRIEARRRNQNKRNQKKNLRYIEEYFQRIERCIKLFPIS